MTGGRESLLAARKAKEFCDHCGEELLRCIECGGVIKKNYGWVIHMDIGGAGPAVGSYHDRCLARAKATAASTVTPGASQVEQEQPGAADTILEERRVRGEVPPRSFSDAWTP